MYHSQVTYKKLTYSPLIGTSTRIYLVLSVQTTSLGVPCRSGLSDHTFSNMLKAFKNNFFYESNSCITRCNEVNKPLGLYSSSVSVNK